jgi:hypothetical protein
MKFRNLSDVQEVTRQSTATYEFHSLAFEHPTGQLDESGQPIMETLTPWIEVRPVGEINKPYINAVLASQSKNRRRITKGRIDAAMLAENRAQDCILYPEHVFTGNWGHWIDDATGEPAPYSKEAASSLLRQLPIEEVDELRAFCNDTASFRR